MKNLYNFIDDIINLIYNNNIFLLLNNFNKQDEIDKIFDQTQGIPTFFNYPDNNLNTNLFEPLRSEQ